MGFLNTAAILSCGIPAALATIPSISGYTLTWSDDFDGDAGTAPSSANWIVDAGTSYPGGPAGFGTGEIETYTSSSSNIALTGTSSLMIKPILSGGQWTSGRLESVRDDFIAPAGGKLIIQASVMMPAVSGDQAVGYWPAFWALGAAYRGNYWNWPGIGEFDIMENVNGLDWVSSTLHCGVDPNGPCDETNGLTASVACPDSTCQGNYHTYNVEVDRTTSPEQMTFSVDGQVYHTVTETDVGDATTWSDAVDDAKFVLFNVAIGGQYPDKVYGTTTPISATAGGYPMYVDYVAVYNA
jgi:hypothetical protein